MRRLELQALPGRACAAPEPTGLVGCVDVIPGKEILALAEKGLQGRTEASCAVATGAISRLSRCTASSPILQAPSVRSTPIAELHQPLLCELKDSPCNIQMWSARRRARRPLQFRPQGLSRNWDRSMPRRRFNPKRRVAGGWKLGTLELLASARDKTPKNSDKA